MAPLLVSAMVFLILTGVAVAIYVSITSDRRLLQSRMNKVGYQGRIDAAPAGAPAGAGDEKATRALLKWAVERIPKPREVRPRDERRAELLVQAGFKASGMALFHACKLAAMVGGLLLGLAASLVLGAGGGRVILCTILGASVGAFLPGYFLNRRARNRQLDIGRQLSDVLDLLVVCVEAGLGLLESIKVVGIETMEQNLIIGHELSQVAAEVNSGASLGEALRSLADRSGVADIKPLAATLIQSEQLGAQIGPALKASSDAQERRHSSA